MVLVDILSKREFLIRQFFLSKSLKLCLPKYLLAAPNNPLYEEVQQNVPLFDPINYASETNRELFYQTSSKINFILLKDFFFKIITLNNLNHPLNFNFLNNNLFIYLFGSTDSLLKGHMYNLDIYKNQYRPMKKGVSNMIKLHATGAVAMPTEIRLHILASSKDVIHSWAIPSAGIKIDCVPGYSSHRIAIFLISGIF
jgi:hypothetical protein